MLLLAGCSFIANPDLPEVAFGREVWDKKLVRINAWGGAGNAFISRAVLDNLDKVNNVLILWTGFSRIDIELPVEMVDQVSSYYEGTPIHITNDTVWLHSGGFDGTWYNYSRTKYEKYIYEYIKSQYLPCNWNYLNNKNLRIIAGTLNTLEQLNIEYKFGFIYDIFSDHISEQQSLGSAVDRNNPLLNLINWDNCLSETPYDFCKDRGLLSDDRFNPTREGYNQWWNAVKQDITFDLT